MIPESPPTPSSSIGGLYFCSEGLSDNPGHTKPNDNLGSSVWITTCKSNEDPEGTTEVEPPSFPGLAAHETVPDGPTRPSTKAERGHTSSRLALQNGGISPRLWPDFNTMCSRREKSLIDKTTIVLKAESDHKRRTHWEGESRGYGHADRASFVQSDSTNLVASNQEWTCLSSRG